MKNLFSHALKTLPAMMLALSVAGCLAPASLTVWKGKPVSEFIAQRGEPDIEYTGGKKQHYRWNKCFPVSGNEISSINGPIMSLGNTYCDVVDLYVDRNTGIITGVTNMSSGYVQR